MARKRKIVQIVTDEGFMLKHGQTIVFIGDSITDCGRRDSNAPYGDGYVKAAIDLIAARYPERRIRFLNEGISGNTVLDLRERWQDDALALKPDWISVKIGINDVHAALNGSRDISPETFESVYRELLTRVRSETSARLILIDPFYMSLETNPELWRGKVNAALTEYLAAVGRLAQEFGALHVRTHERFARALQYLPSDALGPEPVHPYPSAHLIIALGVLEVLRW